MDNNDQSSSNYKLYIINDYKNLEGIDINDNNIKQKPVKYIYCFKNVKFSVHFFTYYLKGYKFNLRFK